MRKIKECICDGTQKSEYGALPISISNFLINMSIILVADAYERLKQDVYDVEIGDEKFSGQSIDDPKLSDVLQVLNGNDFLRFSGQHLQLQSFINWFIDQEEPKGFWYEDDFLVEKWNEFAVLERERRR